MLLTKVHGTMRTHHRTRSSVSLPDAPRPTMRMVIDTNDSKRNSPYAPSLEHVMQHMGHGTT
jgi:hypothetical protein